MVSKNGNSIQIVCAKRKFKQTKTLLCFLLFFTSIHLFALVVHLWSSYKNFLRLKTGIYVIAGWSLREAFRTSFLHYCHSIRLKKNVSTFYWTCLIFVQVMLFFSHVVILTLSSEIHKHQEFLINPISLIQ